MTETSAEPTPAASVPLRIAFVSGVTPGKWLRIWAARMPTPIEAVPVSDPDQLVVLYDGRADMCFVRLPVDREGLGLIPLYRETPVVLVPVDHTVTAFDEVSVADLADEHLLQDPDGVPEWRDVAVEIRDGSRVDVPPMTVKDAIEVVATGAGIMILPKSVARLFNRKDVTHRPVSDIPESQVGLAWLTAATDSRIEEFIGVVRGRTARSSRTGDGSAPGKEASAKKAAAKKVAAQKRKPQRRPVGTKAARGGAGGRRGPR